MMPYVKRIKPVPPLSAYETQRLETIAANQRKLVELGIDRVVQVRARPATEVPKPKRQKAHELRAQPSRSTRSTRESSDGHAELNVVLAQADAEAEAAANPPRKRPRYENWRFCAYNIHVPLTANERAKLVVPSDWIQDFASHWESEGDSEANRRSVLKVIRALAAGEGLASSQRDGLFAEGRKIDLHSDLEQLALEAHYFLPMKSMPTWMKDLYPEAPPGGPRDKSNGWWANHPIMKMQKYQRLLRDQAIEEETAAKAGAAKLA